MELIDATGKPCPVPVVEAEKALGKPGVDGVTVKVDNLTAVQNLEKMAGGRGYGFAYEKKSDSIYHVSLIKNSMETQTAQQPAKIGGHVAAVGNEAMGTGADELGRMLMKAYIYSLSELETPPSAMIFYNSGARLTSESSGTLADLISLEKSGTQILTCGTCVDYYQLPPPAVGRIANMYEIAGIISEATTLMSL